MSRLTETRVQDYALAFLRERYRRKALGNRIFADREVRTKKEYGGKRADGLIAFRHWLYGLQVVSLEAKSYNTLAAIRPRLIVRLWLYNSLRAGLVITILSGALFFLFKFDDWYLQRAIPINTFGIGALAYGLLTRNHFGHRRVDMISQLAQYPANESWLACSTDSLAELQPEKRKALERLCRSQKVGLLAVYRDGTVAVLNKAGYRRKWAGNYLDHYARASEILKAIG